MCVFQKTYNIFLRHLSKNCNDNILIFVYIYGLKQKKLSNIKKFSDKAYLGDN